MKTCSKCKVPKPESEFYRNKLTKDGLIGSCKDCDKQYKAAHYEANAERNRQRAIESHKKFPDRRRNNKLRQDFGLTLAEYKNILEKQKGVCAICNHSESEKRLGTRKNLSVDHDHLTNTIRGLLCSACNTGLGKFKDSPETLRKAADYLETANKNQNQK